MREEIMKHYLIKAVESVMTYKTPKKIMEFIQKEILIQNPPYNVNNHERRQYGSNEPLS